MSVSWLGKCLGWLMLSALLAPLVYACWLSFTPDELLAPPLGHWSLRWYDEFFHSARWTAALRESLRVGVLAVLCSLAAGLPLAYALARLHFRGQSLVLGAVLLPLVAPPLLVGMSLLPTLQALGLWGSSTSLALAHSLYGMAMVCWLTRAALLGVSPEIENAARGLGAGPWKIAYRITLPLIGPAVLAGSVMAFVLSLNEFILSLFLATPESETLPRVLWPNLRYALSPLVAVASCVTTLVTAAGIALATCLAAKPLALNNEGRNAAG
jgi:putative spermidine/putrescine transport system permease protein